MRPFFKKNNKTQLSSQLHRFKDSISKWNLLASISVQQSGRYLVALLEFVSAGSIHLDIARVFFRCRIGDTRREMNATGGPKGGGSVSNATRRKCGRNGHLLDALGDVASTDRNTHTSRWFLPPCRPNGAPHVGLHRPRRWCRPCISIARRWSSVSTRRDRVYHLSSSWHARFLFSCRPFPSTRHSQRSRGGLDSRLEPDQSTCLFESIGRRSCWINDHGSVIIVTGYYFKVESKQNQCPIAGSKASTRASKSCDPPWGLPSPNSRVAHRSYTYMKIS